MKKIAAVLCVAVTMASAATANSPAPAAADGASKAPTRAEQMARGQQIAGAVCVACHGLDGISPIAANPNISGMSAEYIAKQLELFKSAKRVNPIMQGMVANLTSADMQALGTYYFAQRGTSAAVARDKVMAEKGQKIYRAGIPESKVPACAGCHGGTGAGIPSAYPALAGQWPDYTFHELQSFASGQRKHPQMTAIAARMKPAELQAVSEYIAGMRGK